MIRHHHRVASAIALTLALASAAPASARLELNPATGADNQSTTASTSLCSEVCSASGYVSHNSGAALPHDPRPRAVALAGAWIRVRKHPDRRHDRTAGRRTPCHHDSRRDAGRSNPRRSDNPADFDPLTPCRLDSSGDPQ